MAQDYTTIERLVDTAPTFKNTLSDRKLERLEKEGYYGLMYAGKYEWDNQKVIAEAYAGYDPAARPGNRRKRIRGQKRRSTKAYTTWMGIDEALDCLAEIRPYNQFHHRGAARALEAAGVDMRVVVGREGSPVIYVWTAEPREVMAAFRALDEEMEVRGAGPDELGAIFNADHYPVKVVGKPIEVIGGQGPTLVRAWWD